MNDIVYVDNDDEVKFVINSLRWRRLKKKIVLTLIITMTSTRRVYRPTDIADKKEEIR